MTEVPEPDHETPNRGSSSETLWSLHVPSQRTSTAGLVSSPLVDVKSTFVKLSDDTPCPTIKRSPCKSPCASENPSASPASMHNGMPEPVNEVMVDTAPETVAMPTLAFVTERFVRLSDPSSA